MNFIKLFDDYHIPYSTKINRGWVNSNCPYCDTKMDSFNMGFNPSSDYCNCWKCGSHDLYKTLSKLLMVSTSDIKGILNDYFGRVMIFNDLNKKTPSKSILALPTDTFTMPERRYLTSRGFSPKFLHEKYGVVGGGIVGEWKHRIIIPLTLNGRIVSWTGRSLLDKNKLKDLNIPRYKNLSIEKSVVNPKECLFNIDNARGKTVVLTEGAFDVMRLGDDFVCSFGTSLTEAQVRQLSTRFEKVFVMFDNEPEAQAKAKKIGLKLSSMGLDVEVVDAYSEFNKNDGGELTENEVLKIRKELRI